MENEMRGQVLDQNALPFGYRVEPEQNEDGIDTYAIAHYDSEGFGFTIKGGFASYAEASQAINEIA